MSQTCGHLDQVDLAATPSSTGCEDCLKTGDRWVHLRMCLSCGDVAGFPLHDGLSVQGFYRGVTHILDGLGLGTPIRAVPFGVPMTTPFDDDVEHASFDADAVRRFWTALRWTDTVLHEFAGWF